MPPNRMTPTTSILAALAVIPRAAASAGLRRELRGGATGRPCLGHRNFQFVVHGECSAAAVLGGLDARIATVRWCRHSAEEELAMILGVSSPAEAAAEVEGACLDAVRSRITKSVDFGWVTQMDDTFNKEFFDGRTYWNEGGGRRRKVPQPERPVTFRGNGQRIDAIMRNIAKKRVIEWPDHLPNFQGCELNSAMCCWSNIGMENAVSAPASHPIGKLNNTDVCLVELRKSSTSNHVGGGFTIFQGAEEGDVYCHGMAWENSPAGWNNWFKGNTLFDLSLFEMKKQGHTRNIPGSPMCGCLEQMPVVTRADCTEAKVDSRFLLKYTKSTSVLTAKLLRFKMNFGKCNGVHPSHPSGRNDLSSFYEKLWLEGKVEQAQKDEFDRIIVGDHMCPKAIEDFIFSDAFHCAEDLLECPDGTILMRDPHYFCEFPECPPEPPFTCPQEKMMCPDETVLYANPDTCEFPPCPPDWKCPVGERLCPDGTVLSTDPSLNCTFPECPSGPSCLQDEMHCPDGTVLKRDPATCNFPTCPREPACPTDVMHCPDGTVLKRDPWTHCRFPPCLSQEECPKDLLQCPDGTVLKRDPLDNCQFPPCPSRPECPKDLWQCPDGTQLKRDPEKHCNFPPCQACPQDDFHCPNGTILRRSDPDCTFPACPSEPPSGSCPSDVKHCADGTIVKRDPLHNCTFPTCSQQPSEAPSADPSSMPIAAPSDQLSTEPSAAPSFSPSASTSSVPPKTPSAAPSDRDEPPAVTCPTDEKHCPDGTVLARDPARNCEFPSCPDTPATCSADEKPCPDGTVLARDPARNCEFPMCPSEADGTCPAGEKYCPDGSVLVRDPSDNCSFPPCPAGTCPTDEKHCPDGTVLTRRPEKDCTFPSCVSDPPPTKTIQPPTSPPAESQKIP